MNSPLVGLRGRFAMATLLWALAIALLLAVPGGEPREITHRAIWMVLSLVAAFATWHRSNAEPEAWQGWRLIAVALLMPMTYSAMEALRVSFGLPSVDLVAVVLTVLPYPLTVVGIMLWPLAQNRQPSRTVLDAVVFAGSLFFLTWVTGLNSFVRDPRVGAADVILNLSWFGGAALVLGIVAYAGDRSHRRLRGPLGLIATAVAVSMLGALYSARATVTGLFFWAQPSELLWLGAPLFFLLAALSPDSVGRMPTERRDATSFAGDAIIYLPAGAVIAVVSLTDATQDPVPRWLALVIGAAFIGRQFLTLHDGRQLAHELETKVSERTSQLEESQDALVRAERMNAIGQVAAGIAHDFGNALQAIMAQVDVLRLGITEGKPRERLDNMSKAAQSANEFVRALLRIGKPDSGERVELDLAEMVRGVPWVFRVAEESGIVVDLAGLQPARVLADHGQLEQVLANLVGNARDAMASGGKLVVETGLVSRRNAGAHTWALLAVSDTGIGMTAEQVARIFEPFYTTKTAGRGTGLGLSAVYAIVNGLGGTIHVESTPGVGSRFEVLIPPLAGD
jgi:signal transduction histidine kinase